MDPFDQAVARLRDFIATHGRLPKGTERSHDGFSLGQWLLTKRAEALYGQLSPARRTTLEAIWPGWTARPFEAGLTRLRDFIAAHGRTPTMTERSPDGFAVGNWLIRKRAQSRAGRLSRAHRSALDAACPGWATPERRQGQKLTSS